jgi:hypothetical protein
MIEQLVTGLKNLGIPGLKSIAVGVKIAVCSSHTYHQHTKGRMTSTMKHLRVMLIAMGIIAMVIIPVISSAEDEEVLREIRIKSQEQLEPGDALFLFSRDLAELQTICKAVQYISYAQTSDEEYQSSVERHVRAAMKKLYAMMETYENSPVMIEGFTIHFPFEIQVDFKIVQPD